MTIDERTQALQEAIQEHQRVIDQLEQVMNSARRMMDRAACGHYSIVVCQDGASVVFHCVECGREGRWHNTQASSLLYASNDTSDVLEAIRQQIDFCAAFHEDGIAGR